MIPVHVTWILNHDSESDLILFLFGFDFDSDMIFEVRINVDQVASGYVNMMLSFRGGERQPPNVLQMALRFSAAMEARSVQGVHSKDLPAEERLRRVVNEFHSTNGMLQKWHLDEDRFQSILNVIVGTSKEGRDLIAAHLHRFKWTQSALTSELLRKPRWLLTAVPRGVQDHFKVLLTVTEMSQKLFLTLVFHVFHVKTRKVRATQRAKCRMTPAEWDGMVSYSCVFAAVMREVSLLSNKPDNLLQVLEKTFLDLFSGSIQWFTQIQLLKFKQVQNESKWSPSFKFM